MKILRNGAPFLLLNRQHMQPQTLELLLGSHLRVDVALHKDDVFAGRCWARTNLHPAGVNSICKPDRSLCVENPCYHHFALTHAGAPNLIPEATADRHRPAGLNDQAIAINNEHNVAEFVEESKSARRTRHNGKVTG